MNLNQKWKPSLNRFHEFKSEIKLYFKNNIHLDMTSHTSVVRLCSFRYSCRSSLHTCTVQYSTLQYKMFEVSKCHLEFTPLCCKAIEISKFEFDESVQILYIYFVTLSINILSRGTIQILNIRTKMNWTGSGYLLQPRTKLWQQFFSGDILSTFSWGSSLIISSYLDILDFLKISIFNNFNINRLLWLQSSF